VWPCSSMTTTSCAQRVPPHDRTGSRAVTESIAGQALRGRGSERAGTRVLLRARSPSAEHECQVGAVGGPISIEITSGSRPASEEQCKVCAVDRLIGVEVCRAGRRQRQAPLATLMNAVATEIVEWPDHLVEAIPVRTHDGVEHLGSAVGKAIENVVGEGKTRLNIVVLKRATVDCGVAAEIVSYGRATWVVRENARGELRAARPVVDEIPRAVDKRAL